MTSFGYNILGFGRYTAPSGGSIAERSMEFTGFLDAIYMSDANFGAYSYTKVAISAWFKRITIGTDTRIWFKGAACELRIISTNKLVASFQTSPSGFTSRTTTATYTDTSNWYHVLVYMDPLNSTADDRMRLFVNASEVTAFDSINNNPTGYTILDTANSVYVGNSASPSNYFNGLLYQVAFFSGTLPNPSTLYNSGVPIDITGQAGLWSWVNPEDDTTFSDRVLAASWTETGTVVTSAVDVP